MSESHDPTPSARTFAWLTVGVVAFTIYGSLVPFHFHARSFDDALKAFQWVLEHRVGIQSKSDFAANYILGGPLGFCLLAAVRLDKPGGWAKSVLMAVALWPWCVAFAAVVEFTQLWFPERTCSGSDILAQGLGSMHGMVAWIIIGDRLTHWFRHVWASDRVGGTAGRILFAYVSLLMLAQFLPLDLTLSPGEIYYKFKHGKLVLLPFSEQGKLPVWLEVVGLYAPVGMLAAGIPRRPFNHFGGILGVMMRGLLLGVVIETGQMFVNSRTTSTTDVLLGGFGVTLGWSVVRFVMKTEPKRGLNLETALVLGQLYVAFLMVMNWLPLNFDASIGAGKLAEVNWIPFAAAYEKNYLNSLEEAVAKTLLFAPLGAIVIAKGVRRTIRAYRAVVISVLISAIIEAGQLYLPSRVVGPTDLIFAGVGGWLGATATLRLRAYGFGVVYSKPPTAVVPHQPAFAIR
ncbi:hypothetical protein BH11PLA2_BH11PLA2_20630 [soil metagenome]